MSWRKGEQGARKPQEQPAQLKGVFGEGASVVALPDSTATGGPDQPDGLEGSAQGPALTPEQFQRKAQSRGLWDSGVNKAPSQPTQPRAGSLPRAVVGGASPAAANTNFRNPSIGNEVSPPLPAALTAAQPLAAGKASLEAAAAVNTAAASQRELDLGLAETEDVRTGKPVTRGRSARHDRAETDPDAMDTMELDMAKFIQKGGLPQRAAAAQADPSASQAGRAAPRAVQGQAVVQAGQGSAAQKAAEAARAPQAGQAAQATAGAQAARAGQPAQHAQPANATPPTVAAKAAQALGAIKPGTPTERPARPAPSSANSTVLLALIVIAAIIAVLFIGAALGIWRLPWAAAAAHASVSKSVPAKSLPEMRAPLTPTAPPLTPTAPTAQVMATAIAAPTAPGQAEPSDPAAASGNDVAAIAADEAAPMHAGASSGGDPDDDGDRPTPDVAELLKAGRAELRAGHAKEAEALLRPALEKNPNEHHLAELLAQTLIARGAAVEAVVVAQRIVKQRPKRASYRVLLGDAMRRAGDEPGAKAAYREALALDPNLRDAHARLGKLN